jgi:glutaminase
MYFTQENLQPNVLPGFERLEREKRSRRKQQVPFTEEMNVIRNVLPGHMEESRKLAAQGKPASYIPQLATAPNEALGISILDPYGNSVSAGDCSLLFTMQSISKVFTLILALMDRGEDVVFSKVGKEPSGDNFNSMLKLELVEPGIPFNPLINAGAIVISSLIRGGSPEQKSSRILGFFREVANNEKLDCNLEVYRSESATAHRNRSLAYFLKDNGVLNDDVDEVLDIYFRHCAVELSCRDLARMALVLACGGKDPVTGKAIIPRRYVQIAKTFMVTCGMYNASGEFAIGVGLPAKSGVSGGILTMVPGRYGIGVVGPALNRKGNSVAGVHLLKTLSREFEWSLF